MKQGCEKRHGTPVAPSAAGSREPGIPGFGKLPKPRWRAALAGLAGPVVRVHRFRNLRTAMLYDALSRDQDCGSS
jgi:hypothetical protein